MDINNANELDDVNFGALAIADGNNNEVGAGKNVAEHLRVPVDHPMAFFFNDDESSVAMKIVLFGGIRVAGKIRRTTKWFWDKFGGDDNWNKLLAVHTLPLMYQSLGLSTLAAGPSKDYLKRLLIDAPAAPLPPGKPFSTYSFEVKCDILGKKLHVFVPTCVCSDEICIPIPQSYGDHLADAFKEVGVNLQIIGVSLCVRVFDKSNGKFAILARTEAMRMYRQRAGPAFESADIHNAIHDVSDDPDVAIPLFRTYSCIDTGLGKPTLKISFVNDFHSEFVESNGQILRLMERLEWK